jgi:glycosyltransferase involved in cell wall biosynthesis
MIVRDEESLLSGCLESVRGAVDDIVVVDTGSRDATKAMALAAGAKVVDFEWCDDFAAARNEALKYARGQWILQLDADERLAPGSAGPLRKAANNARFDCGMLRLHDATRVDSAPDAVISGRERQGEVQMVARLLRRAPNLAYVDAIHENVLPWVVRRGKKIGPVDVDIIHLGATEHVVSSKKKIARNTLLLRRRIDRDPTDVVAYGYLAHDYLRSGSMDEALAVTEAGWAHVALARKRNVSVHRLALARAYLYIPRRRFAELRETMAYARELEGEHPDFSYAEAYSWELESSALAGEARADARRRARDGFLTCLGFRGTIFASAFVAGASSWAALTRLGTLDLLEGNAVEAAREFDAALELRPALREAMLGRIETMIALGDPAGALRRVEPLLDGFPDTWTLAATAVEALGRRADSAFFAKHAHTLLPKGFVAPHRRERLQALVGHS